MDLSVIIVSWNVKDKLRANLNALLNSSGDFNLEIIVIDNHSQDGSPAMLRQEFPQIKLISNQTNRGFAAANNQGIKIAQGRFILLLNPDMKLEPSTLNNLLTWAQANPQATVSSGKLLTESGELIRHVRRFPTVLDQLAIIFKLPHLFPSINRRYLAQDFDYSQAAAVDSVRGAFFLINQAAYQKISGQAKPYLDERYFIWFEEVDFCQAVYRQGGEVWYTPVAVAVDYVGQSFKQVKRPTTQRYFSQSMISYFAKWRSPWETSLLKVSWRLVLLFLPKNK